jgi:hypothetical protein
VARPRLAGINYATRVGKKDRKRLAHAADVGCELQSNLLAGLQADGQTHLDELTERMAWLEKQRLGRPLARIIGMPFAANVDKSAPNRPDRPVAGLGLANRVVLQAACVEIPMALRERVGRGLSRSSIYGGHKA